MILSRLVSFAVLPAQLVGTRCGKMIAHYYGKIFVDNSREYLKAKGKGEEVTIETNDRVKLNGMLFKKEVKKEESKKSSRIGRIWNNLFPTKVTEKSKIWINFLGNGGAYEFLDPDQIQKIQKLGFDVLGFNYRSVAKSEGSPTQKGLIEDGKEIIRYANSLGYDEIYIYGHSIGGAFATKAVAQIKDEDPIVYKKIKLIADRTFSSLKAVIKAFNIFRVFRGIACKIINFTNWNIKVKKDWEKIDIKKCLIFDSLDEVIGIMGSLYKKVEKTTPKHRIVKLIDYGHNADLEEDVLTLAIEILN